MDETKRGAFHVHQLEFPGADGYGTFEHRHEPAGPIERHDHPELGLGPCLTTAEQIRALIREDEVTA